MANRVILGKRNETTWGLFVSKAGKDVFTCSDNDLLFNSGAKSAQVIYDATVSLSAHDITNSPFQYPYYTVNHASFGFLPFVHIEVVSTSPTVINGLLPIPGAYPQPYNQTNTGFRIWLGSYGDIVGGATKYFTFTTTIRVRLLNFVNPTTVAWPYPNGVEITS